MDRLLIRTSDGRETALPLDGTPLLIGTDTGCHIVLDAADPAALPQHALLDLDGGPGAWRVRCYDANAPLLVDGLGVPEVTLADGTRFAIGGTAFEFSRTAEPVEIDDPEAAAARLHEAEARIVSQLGRVVVGQAAVVKQLLVALFARGHCLLVGTPGLAKTLMAKSLAGTLELDCRRVQFTPDLMPSDILGTQMLEEDPATSRREFRFKKGPVFTHLLLADEINRTPPKTQAALLEAMQERRVTVSGATYELPEPFFVIATQNPIEQEGTYPLPEAQLDRFMFCVKVGFPSAEEEEEIILETTRDAVREVGCVLDREALLAFQRLVRQTPVSRHVGTYVTRLVRATRPDAADAPEFVTRWVRWGAGPRAGQYLLLAAKAHALLEGRLNVSCDDVRAYALPVLRHRILCNFAASSEGVDSDEIVKRLLQTVPEPDYSTKG